METTTKTQPNPLEKLADYGQSPWLDFIRRNLITSGELQKMIDEDGLKGVTSNPAISKKRSPPATTTRILSGKTRELLKMPSRSTS